MMSYRQMPLEHFATDVIQAGYHIMSCVCVCVPLEHFITDVTGLSQGQEKG